MSEFCHGEKGGPFFGLVRGEQPWISFQLLVDSFCFSVSLWVVSGGKGDIILEKAGKFPSKGRGELWSPVQDHFGVEAKSRENMNEEEFGNSCSVNVFCARAINYPLHKAMVYHDHYRIKTMRIR